MDARRKTVELPAGRSKCAVNAPLADGLTVATIVPVPIVEQDADARIVICCGGLASGSVTTPWRGRDVPTAPITRATS